MKIDDTDVRIIEELRKNSRITMTELGQRVHLTGQACKNRVERLEDMHILQRYTVNINCPVYGYQVHAMIHIDPIGQNHNKYLQLIEENHEKTFLHNYRISGEGSYLLEGYFKTTSELDELIKKIGEVASYKVTIILNDMMKD